MERTDLRDAFFAETHRDPYARAITHLASDCWALGYEQALRDHGLDETRLRETHGDRVQKALEYLTDRRRAAYTQAVVAFAEIGRANGLRPPW